MKINVTENKVSIKEEQILNENEYNIHKIQFHFSSEYTDNLVKVALFSIDNHTYKKIISNNECDIPPEVLTQRGYSILGVYAYKTEQDTLVLRYSPSPTRISVYDGSYKADAENSEPITPSEIEQYQQILQNSLQQFQNQYNALVEETEGDIQAIEDELQRKVDEGYFDGEDGFSPIAKVIQKSNGATIEIEDKNGKTTADVLNGEDGYTPVRGVDYWTEEDKQEVEEEATQQIEGKIEEYNENAAEKLNQYNQNSVQKTNDYNTNASSKLSEYNSNAETKKSAYDENATQKTNSFNTNATNKLTEYNTNHTEKMSAYNSNNTEKLNAFNENATQKTEDFDEHTEQIQTDIEVLQRTDDEILSNFNKFDEVTGEDITLNETTEIKFAKPPLPMGNSEQETNLYNGIIEQGSLINGEPPSSIATNRIRTKDYIEVVPNTTLPISFLGATDYVAVFYTNDKRYKNQTDWANSGADCEISNDVYYMKLIFKKSNGLAITPSELTNLQIGNIPNPDYPQEITNVTGDVEVVVSNKNLGTFMSGFISLQGDYRTSSDMCFYFRVTKGQSYRYQSTGNRSIGAIFDSVPTENQTECIDGTLFNPLPKQSAFVAPASGIMVIYTNLNFSQEVMDSFQVEKGTEATSVVPHKEQILPLTLGNIELCKIGDYQDYFYKQSNKWYLHKEIAKKALDGSENWGINTSYDYNLFYLLNVITNYLTIGENICLCNYYQSKNNVNDNTNAANTNNTICFRNNTTTKMLYITNDNITSLEDFKTWLSTHNTIVYYVLATPTDTEITDTALISQLEAISNAISYEEQTNISGTSDGSNPIFTVQAYKDLNKELNNKVDKVQGKELSSNDFTDTLKEKLEGLENYDDTEIKADISDIQDEQIEQNTDIEKLQTENARLKATLPTTTGEGQTITLNKTAELEFKKPPLPMGNSEQESTEGRQLLPYPYADTTKTTSGITFTDNGDGSITINGTSTAESTFFLLGGWSTTNNIPDNMKKTISIKASGTNNVVIQASLKDENGNSVTNTLYGNNDTRSADVSTAVSGYIRIVLPSGVTMNNVVVKPYIVEGTYTTATFPEYEPYTGGEASPNPDYPQEITNVTGDVEVKVQNKNLFDNILSNSISKSNCTISYDNGEIVLNATGTDAYIGEFRSVGSSYNAICGQLIKVKPNTKYTVQNTNPLFNKNFINYWNKDKTVTKQIELMGGSSTRTFTTEFNTEYITFRTGYAQTVSGQQYKFNITVIEGDYTSVTIPSYTPHKEQVLPLTLGNIELCKIGDYQDYFYKQSNKWYLHKEIGKEVLNGTQNIAKNDSDSSNYLYYMNLGTRKIGGTVLSNKLTYKTLGQINGGNDVDTVGISTLSTSRLFYFNLGYYLTVNTVAGVNSYLTGNNITVYYQLEEPVNTEITDTTLISQLEAISNAISYEEQTNISSNTIALFNVEAYQSTKLVLQESNVKYESLEARVALLE